MQGFRQPGHGVSAQQAPSLAAPPPPAVLRAVAGVLHLGNVDFVQSRWVGCARQGGKGGRRVPGRGGKASDAVGTWATVRDWLFAGNGGTSHLPLRACPLLDCCLLLNTPPPAPCSRDEAAVAGGPSLAALETAARLLGVRPALPCLPPPLP